MKYAIGLDIGIASVGYAVLALDHEENPWGIIRLGSRIFDVAENPKDGASLALPRREARSVRRRLRRHHHGLCRQNEIIPARKKRGRSASPKKSTAAAPFPGLRLAVSPRSQRKKKKAKEKIDFP